MNVSIVIRSKNEERLIDEVLQQVFAQEFPETYEVIVLDSGSQDRTLDVVRSFPIRLEHLPAEKFTFGYALNYGASLANGDYVVFLSAHCLPCGHFWLSELLGPLKSNTQLVATYGRQVPQPGVNLFEEPELVAAYTLREDQTVRAPFSNANSAIRKEVLQHYPFDESIPTGEDFLWAYTLPEECRVQYVHSAAVFHSHPPTLRYWRQRWYSEGMMAAYLTQLYCVTDPW
jgi:glycosyltransferase involved in cell wall biosynthesis